MTMKISLPATFEAFIEAQVTSGQYASASDVVTETLRLLEMQQADAAKLRWLQEAIRLGLESGDAGEVDIEDIIAEANAQRAAAGR